MASFRDQINQFIISASNNRIKSFVRQLIRMYKDDWVDILANELKYQYPRTYDDLKFLLTIEKNPLKQIVDKISIVYKGNVRRAAHLPTEETEDAQEENQDESIENDENYERVIGESNWPGGLSQTVERFTNLSNQNVVLTNYRNDKIDYEMFTFDNCQLFSDPEDWQMIVGFIHYNNLELPNYDNDRSGLTTRFGLQFEKFSDGWCYYLADREVNQDTGEIFYRTVWRQKFKGVEFSPVGDPEELPYKDSKGHAVLNVTLFKSAYPDTSLLDFSTGSDRFDANLNIGVNMVLMNNLIKYNSFKKIVLTAEKKEDLPNELISAPEVAIKLPSGTTGGGASATVLDMQSDIQQFYDNILARSEDIANTYGVGLQNTQNSGAAMSGFAIALSNIDLLTRRDLQINLYRKYEEHLFEITRIVYNAWQKDDKLKINEGSTFSIDFDDDLFPVNKQEQTAEDAFNLTNNITNPVELIMRDNPDLTEEQATEKWRKNIELNNTNNSTSVAAATIPTQPAAIEAEEETEDEVEEVEDET